MKQIIRIENHQQIVNVIKVYLSNILTNYYEEFLLVELPNQDNFQNRGEYEQAKKEQMIQLIEKVSKIKEECFVSILNAYNLFLDRKRDLDRIIKQQEEESILAREHTQKDIKKVGLLTLALTIVFPRYMPLFIAINLPRIGSDYLVKKVYNSRAEKNAIFQKKIVEIQISFFEFENTLRENYHKTNEELKKLKIRAEAGENIMTDILYLIEPERIGIPKTKENIFIQESAIDSGIDYTFQKK